MGNLSAQSAIGNLAVKDGYYYDPDTGEVVGVDPPRKGFQIDSMDNLEWYTQKVFDAQMEIKNLEARKRAMAENIDRMILQQQQRIKALDYMFGPDVEHFLRNHLTNSTRRCVDTPYGRVGLRRSGGGIRIVNEEAALRFCQDAFPEAVKTTQSVLVSALKGHEDTLPASAFVIEQPQDRLYINPQVRREVE